MVSTSVGTKKRTAQGPKKYWHQAYLCTTKAWKGAALCDGQRTYSVKKVERALLGTIHRTLGALDAAAVIQQARAQAAARLWAQDARRQVLDKHIRDAEAVRAAWLARLDQLFAHPESSPYPEEVLAQKVQEATDTLRRLVQEREALQQSAADVERQRRSLDEFLHIKDQWWQQFLGADRSRQKELLKRIVDQVAIGRDGYDIYYRFDFEALALGRDAGAIEWQENGAWAPVG